MPDILGTPENVSIGDNPLQRLRETLQKYSAVLIVDEEGRLVQIPNALLSQIRSDSTDTHTLMALTSKLRDLGFTVEYV